MEKNAAVDEAKRTDTTEFKKSTKADDELSVAVKVGDYK